MTVWERKAAAKARSWNILTADHKFLYSTWTVGAKLADDQNSGQAFVFSKPINPQATSRKWAIFSVFGEYLYDA